MNSEKGKREGRKKKMDFLEMRYDSRSRIRRTGKREPIQ